MRKVFPLFLFAVFWVLPAGAQNPPIPITTLTASGSSCVSGSTTAGSFLIVNITPAQGASSFTINANAGGNTISFYASGDGGKTYVTLSVTPSNSTTTVTTTTGTGVWRASVAGYTNVCMLESTKSSGNTLVNIAPSTASALGLGGGGGGSGITGLTAGTIPVAATSTTIQNGSLTDDGAGNIGKVVSFTAPATSDITLTSGATGNHNIVFTRTGTGSTYVNGGFLRYGSPAAPLWEVFGQGSGDVEWLVGLNGGLGDFAFEIGGGNGVLGYKFPATAATTPICDNTGISTLGHAIASCNGLTQSGTITFSGVTTGTNADFACFAAGGVMTLQTTACTVSSQRFKQNIHPLSTSALSEVMKLKPVTFNRIPNQENPDVDVNAYVKQIGLIAENVASVDPKAAVYEQDGVTPKSYRQESIIALLVKAVQEQQKEIEQLRQR